MTQKFPICTHALAITTVASMLVLATPITAEEKAASEDKNTTRVGTCEDAKSQSKYWCEEREKVTVVSFGLECENAKKNMEEACEGIKSVDKPYKFKDSGDKKTE